MTIGFPFRLQPTDADAAAIARARARRGRATPLPMTPALLDRYVVNPRELWNPFLDVMYPELGQAEQKAVDQRIREWLRAASPGSIEGLVGFRSDGLRRLVGDMVVQPSPALREWLAADVIAAASSMWTQNGDPEARDALRECVWPLVVRTLSEPWPAPAQDAPYKTALAQFESVRAALEILSEYGTALGDLVITTEDPLAAESGLRAASLAMKHALGIADLRLRRELVGETLFAGSTVLGGLHQRRSENLLSDTALESHAAALFQQAHHASIAVMADSLRSAGFVTEAMALHLLPLSRSHRLTEALFEIDPTLLRNPAIADRCLTASAAPFLLDGLSALPADLVPRALRLLATHHPHLLPSAVMKIRARTDVVWTAARLAPLLASEHSEVRQFAFAHVADVPDAPPGRRAARRAERARR